MSKQEILKKVEAPYIKADLPRIDVGDNVDVHTRIIEGEKERVQIFSGVVIKRTGSGISDSITVRRIVANEGVERSFPLSSPKVAKVEITRHGKARRAKLYYLRDRVGKARRLRDRRRGLQHLETDLPGTAKPVTHTPKTKKAEKPESAPANA